uniref:Uncharacterized protein n=1 Tax=Ciona intestinalis TaxID=7719 RepID=H2Y3G6_CIOIN
FALCFVYFHCSYFALRHRLLFPLRGGKSVLQFSSTNSTSPFVLTSDSTFLFSRKKSFRGCHTFLFFTIAGCACFYSIAFIVPFRNCSPNLPKWTKMSVPFRGR